MKSVLPSQNIEELNFQIDIANVGEEGTIANWNIQIPQNIEGKKILEIKNGIHFELGGTQSQFPSAFTINSSISGGFLDKDCNPTNVLAYFFPTEINSNIENDVITYNVKYSLNCPVAWEIGNSQTVSLTLNEITEESSRPVMCGTTSFPVVIKIYKIK